MHFAVSPKPRPDLYGIKGDLKNVRMKVKLRHRYLYYMFLRNQVKAQISLLYVPQKS
jgi:hypothetical protein